MKSKILVVLFIIFTPFITCQSGENEITEPQSPQPTIEQFVEETDLSDLSDLPTDPNYIKVVSLKGENPSPYGYVLRKPEAFGEDGLKYPVLICLHGVGSRGNSQNNPNDINKVDQNSAIRAIKIGAWNPAVPVAVFAPQTNNNWNPNQLQNFIEYIKSNYANATKTNRIYISGFSMGGFGAWSYLEEFGYQNSLIAAAVSMAGAPDGIENVEPLKMMPFWAFHGDKDPTVSVNRSIQVVASFKALYPSQNHQKLTVFTQDDFEGQFHRIDNGIYDRTFFNKNHTGNIFDQDVINWMLRFKRND